MPYRVNFHVRKRHKIQYTVCVFYCTALLTTKNLLHHIRLAILLFIYTPSYNTITLPCAYSPVLKIISTCLAHLGKLQEGGTYQETLHVATVNLHLPRVCKVDQRLQGTCEIQCEEKDLVSYQVRTMTVIFSYIPIAIVPSNQYYTTSSIA